MPDADAAFPAQQPPGTPHPHFPNLFSPLPIGPIVAKNRILNSAHGTHFVRDGLYTDQYVAYHRERARGGAAIIVSSATSVDPEYGSLQNVDDRIIPWYEKLAAAVHPYGARYFAELAHSGRQGEYAAHGAAVFQAPSAVPLQHYGGRWRIPHELEPARIRAIIAAHAAAARRCRTGGIDGIELHFAHGNLIQQFLSPLTNQRTDEWGGSLDNRLRFAREVLYAVRDAIGRNLVVGCRLTGGEWDDGGLTQHQMMEVASALDDLNLLDYVSVTMGHYSDALNASRNIPDMSFEPGLWRQYGGGIKDVVRVPVFLVGRINDPTLAEGLIAGGQCDVVVLARALMADPYLPLKAFEGRVDDIRRCVGAQDGCWGRYETGRGLSCVQNPTVGLEQVWGGELPPADQPRSVVVVGGGPAGLECARVAATRGHRVTLFERGDHLGGQVPLAAKIPQRAELAEIVAWLERQCEKAGVEVRLRTEATVDVLLGQDADVLVIATGSASVRPAVPIDASLPFFDVRAVLDGQVAVDGRRVLVIDESGGRPGFGVAEHLALRGHEVELITPLIYPGQGIESTSWRLIYQRLLELNVGLRPLTAVARVERGRVTLRHVYSGAETTLDGLDAVVTAMLPRADDGLYRSLAPRFAAVHLIGDALAPRGIEEAYADGHKVGREI